MHKLWGTSIVWVGFSLGPLYDSNHVEDILLSDIILSENLIIIN